MKSILPEALNNRPEIRIGEKIYKIDDRKSSMIKINKINNDKKLSDIDKLDEILKVAVGEDAGKEIINADYSFRIYIELIKIITASITGEDYEVVDKRFQNAKDTIA